MHTIPYNSFELYTSYDDFYNDTEKKEFIGNCYAVRNDYGEIDYFRFTDKGWTYVDYKFPEVYIMGLYSDKHAFLKADKKYRCGAAYLIQRSICYNSLVPCDLYMFKENEWKKVGVVDWKHWDDLPGFVFTIS